MEKMEKNFDKLALSGFFMLLVLTGTFIAAIWLFINMANHSLPPSTVFWSIGLFVCAIIISAGFYIIEPNEAKVMVFFGKYAGTNRRTGFFWSNPFYTKKAISLRARNLDVPPIKVNDKAGNPILIGMVLVWKVADTYRCTFDIDVQLASDTTKNPRTAQSQRMEAYENFVKVQSDSALRSIAGHYPYDSQSGQDETTLRSGSEEIISRLENELNSRLDIAGIQVIEARINYLAYAPEIASVMLRRQQAEAIISAREKIVEGAVSMVHLALNKLSEDQIVTLDEEKKASMVSNLLVVLCADEQAQPVINTGTLYQ